MNYYVTWHESASDVCKVVCVEEYFILSTSVYSVCLQLCLPCLFSVMVIIYLRSATPHPAILPLNPRIQQFYNKYKVLLMVLWKTQLLIMCQYVSSVILQLLVILQIVVTVPDKCSPSWTAFLCLFLRNAASLWLKTVSLWNWLSVK